MSYPTLGLASDPNQFRVTALSSVTRPPFDEGPYSDRCETGCENGVPSMFWALGQRRACCEGNGGANQHCAQGGLLKSAALDDLSGRYCGYARNARYVGQFGDVTPSLPITRF